MIAAPLPTQRAETPSGLPDEAGENEEVEPLGVPEADPDGDADRGAEAMPGIPTEGEPDTAG